MSTLTLPDWAPVLGTDLSGWQRAEPGVSGIHYDAMRDAGVRFCWVKASQGNTNEAKLVNQHVRGCEESGVPVGLYHFAVPDRRSWDDPVQEARHFADEVLDLAAKDLVPVLDYEEHHPEGQDTQWCVRFLVELVILLGVTRVGLYVGKLARRGHVDVAQVRKLLASMGVELVVWSPLYPTPDGTPLDVTMEVVHGRGPNGPRIPDWDVWQVSSSWRPSWATGRVDCNIAKDLNRLGWK